MLRNFQHVKRSARGGNKRLFLNLLNEFYENYTRAPEKLRFAIADENLDELKSYLHQIRGVAGNLSAFKLLAAAREFESAVKNDRRDEFQGFLEKFISAYDLTMKSLSGLTQAFESLGINAHEKINQTGITNRIEIQEIIHKLNAMLIAKDMDAEDYIASVNLDTSTLKIDGEWQSLKNQIRDLDFKNASITLNDIAALLNLPMTGE